MIRLKNSICRFLSIMLWSSVYSHSFSTTWPTIMIDPAGDERYAGRSIENTFERGLTLQCAQAIAQELQSRLPECTVLMSRTAGQMRTDLQRATMANRMAVDLYMSIHFFQETGVTPSIYLYQFSYNDDQLLLPKTLALYPYNQAHRIHALQTVTWIELVKKTIGTTLGSHCQFKGVFKMPFAPLVGIIAPAIGIEVGLVHAHDWNCLIKPLVDSIMHIKEKNI